MARKVPCHYCKIRRRKCERENETEACLRCIRNNRKCVPQGYAVSSHSSSDEEEEINGEKYLDLCHQVEELHLEIKKLEIDLNQQKLIKACSKQEPVWDFRFENGKLLLGTKINDFQELALYKKAFLRYVSPFGQTFQTNTLLFEQGDPGLMQRVVTVMGRINQPRSPHSKNAYSCSIVIKCIQPENHIDDLVNGFFRCFNDISPIVHEASFRKRFQSLANKSEDLVTVAICASTSIFTCSHSSFNSQEKRYIGEYFYNKCIDKLVDTFDEPEYELECLIAINCLQYFMITTLRLHESKKWGTIATLLGSNLKQKFPDHGDGSKQQCYNTRVFYASISRNSIYAHITLYIIEVCMDSKLDTYNCNGRNLDILPDESSSAKTMLELANCIEKLISDPRMQSIFINSHQSFVRKSADWKFEDVFSFEKIVSEWWKALPDQFKLASTPFNCTKEQLEKCFDVQKLMMCAYIHVVAISVQSNFISPKQSNGAHQMVGERAIQSLLYGAETILVLTKQLQRIDKLCIAPSRVLIRSLDALVSIANLKNKTVSHKTQKRIMEFMDEFKKTISPDHHVSSNTSLLSSVSWTNPEINIPSLELYEHYPLPCEALVYDVVQSSVAAFADS
ncbi:hypothetical protein BY458DRAFT_476631, partial [Sporodiniella umbellata]